MAVPVDLQVIEWFVSTETVLWEMIQWFVIGLAAIWLFGQWFDRDGK